VVVGDRGRLVVPAELRERLKLGAGTPLVMLDTPRGVVLATRDQVKRLLRDKLQGPSLVEDLLAERRGLAAAEDET
jgi:AbrB family looped-hinge helix DNA binding protein